MLALCHQVTYKDMIAIPYIVDGSHIFKVLLHNILHVHLSTGLAHLSLQGY